MSDTPLFGRRALLTAGPLALLPGCREPSDTPPPEATPTAPRVAVVGAGLAGLQCAYRLWKAGVDVAVYEANTRVGGRILTFHQTLDQRAFSFELGAAFIDASHAAMRLLARELSIPLEASASPHATEYWVGNRMLSVDSLREDFAAIASRLQSALEQAERSPGDRRLLDNTTLENWLNLNIGKDYPDLALLLGAVYVNEFGARLDSQSALALADLAVAGGTLELPPTGSHGFVAQGGADGFVQRLARELTGRLSLDHHLVRVQRGARLGYVLTFDTSTGVREEVEAEHVVFALPFSALRNVDLLQLGLPEAKSVIQQLGYGTHDTLAAAFERRSWNVGLSVAGDRFGQVVDGAPASTTSFGVLTNRVPAPNTAVALPPVPEANAALLAELTKLKILGVAPDYVIGSAARLRWGSSKFALGSRSCFRAGQWEKRGVAARRVENLHFCGEHCSTDFQGTQEGAAETGLLAASEVLADLSGALPSELSALVELKLLEAQAYRGGDEPNADPPLTRRVRMLRAHAQFTKSL